MAAEPLPGDPVGNPQIPPHIANRTRPNEEIGAGILGPDPTPPLTDEQIEEMSRGLLEAVADYEAEYGPIGEEAKEWVRANFSFPD